jgi:hypothetical protein
MRLLTTSQANGNENKEFQAVVPYHTNDLVLNTTENKINYIHIESRCQMDY